LSSSTRTAFDDYEDNQTLRHILTAFMTQSHRTAVGNFADESNVLSSHADAFIARRFLAAGVRVLHDVRISDLLEDLLFKDFRSSCALAIGNFELFRGSTSDAFIALHVCSLRSETLRWKVTKWLFDPARRRKFAGRNSFAVSSRVRRITNACGSPCGAR